MKDNGQQNKVIEEEIKRLEEVIKRKQKRQKELGKMIKHWPDA